MRWIVLLLLAVGIYFAAQNWSTLTDKWRAGVGQFSGGPGMPAMPDAPSSGVVSLLKGFAGGQSWGDRNVAGLNLDLPFGVESYTPSNPSAPSPNVTSEYFRGAGASRALFIKHQTNTTMAGELMLAWQNKSMVSEAQRLKMNVMSQNTATTVVNGYRARRADWISQSASPRLRVRMVSFERGNQGWLVQLTTLESDPQAEKIFQRIANSAH